MKNLLTGSVIINAVLFQITWFACAIGSANNLIWPAVVACAVLAAFQLHPKNRHQTDFKLIAIAIILGLIIDTAWIQLRFMEYSDHIPFKEIAPLWIIVLWIGFAMTINHSLNWLKKHPLLPAITGLVFAPLSYFAGVKLGALAFTGNLTVITLSLGLAWALAMTVLVKASNPTS
jgi:hypothetical protein